MAVVKAAPMDRVHLVNAVLTACGDLPNGKATSACFQTPDMALSGSA